jgi:hypothetical protein
MTPYPKELHTFPKSKRHPEGPTTAWVYNGIKDTEDPFGSHIIEVTGEKYLLTLDRDIYSSPFLPQLEKLLFQWMQEDGIEPDQERKERLKTTPAC